MWLDWIYEETMLSYVLFHYFPVILAEKLRRDHVNFFAFYLIRVKILLDFQHTSGRTWLIFKIKIFFSAHFV